MSESIIKKHSHSFNHATLEWDEQGQPLSTEFGDVYFTTTNGLEESRHVFLKHNQLQERWQTLDDNQHFCIAETGFGSGLNFLAASELWLANAPKNAQLHFISVEKYPLNKTDLTRALALWPELSTLADHLTHCYPVIVGTGFHRLHFMDGRIKLTLIIDDATQGFTQLLASTHPLFTRAGAKIDAWFLDGFAPSKNPQMWSEGLFDVIGKLSKDGTTAATFSAAAMVKNGLKNAGFSIQKVAGCGRKREMTKGIYTAIPEPLDPHDYGYRGSFSPHPQPWTIQANTPEFTDRHAIIIGGGLAGCQSARALAERGWRITLIERNEHLAQEGSGNPQGVLYAKLSPLNEAQAAFNLASLQYAIHHYENRWSRIGSRCGVLQLAYKPSELALQQQLRERFSDTNELVEFVDATRASQLAGINITQSGLYFPKAGWINPRKLCDDLIDHPNIHVIFNSYASKLKQVDNQWLIIKNDESMSVIAKAPVVVIANAKDALSFSQTNHLPIKSIRGQVTYLPHEMGPENTASKTALGNTPGLSLSTVVCAEGYISPAAEGIFCIGATFNLHDTDTETRVNDHHTNLHNLREHTPAIGNHWNEQDLNLLQGRVGFRCSVPDYLPLVGPAPIVEDFIRDFAPLRKNAKAGITATGSYYSGLYLNIGNGSRGLAYTPLCAELLAAKINRETLPMATELANALNPARFIIRNLTRNKR